MKKDQKMPGAVGSQGRATSEALSALSPTAPLHHYTRFHANVNSDHDWLTGHALDWVTRSLRDAEKAAAQGNDVAAVDLLGVAIQGLSLMEQGLEVDE